MKAISKKQKIFLIMCILSVSTQLTDKVLLTFFFFFFIKGMEKLLSSQNNMASG